MLERASRIALGIVSPGPLAGLFLLRKQILWMIEGLDAIEQAGDISNPFVFGFRSLFLLWAAL